MAPVIVFWLLGAFVAGINARVTGDDSKEWDYILSVVKPERMENGLYLYQDMQLRKEQLLDMFRDMDIDSRMDVRSVSRSSMQKWPSSAIPFAFDPLFSGNRQMVLDSFKEWEKWTCVRFQPAQPGQIKLNIKTVASANACNSPVGYNPAMDVTINLGSGCYTKRSIVHEIGHALGLEHEHQHPNRDQFITVDMNKIEPTHRIWWKTLPADSVTYNLQYDPLSIMHYGAMGMNGERAVHHKTDKLLTAFMGWTDTLSPKSDIPAIRQLYGCDMNAAMPPYGVVCVDQPECKPFSSSASQVCAATPTWSEKTCPQLCGICNSPFALAAGSGGASSSQGTSITSGSGTATGGFQTNTGGVTGGVTGGITGAAAGCTDPNTFCKPADVCTGQFSIWAKTNCPCKCGGGSQTGSSSVSGAGTGLGGGLSGSTGTGLGGGLSGSTGNGISGSQTTGTCSNDNALCGRIADACTGQFSVWSKTNCKCKCGGGASFNSGSGAVTGGFQTSTGANGGLTGGITGAGGCADSNSLCKPSDVCTGQFSTWAKTNCPCKCGGSTGTSAGNKWNAGTNQGLFGGNTWNQNTGFGATVG